MNVLAIEPDRTATPAWAGVRMSPLEFDAIRDWDDENCRDELVDGVFVVVPVSEYWIIDRFRRKMTVFPREDRDVLEAVVAEPHASTTPLLPGFVLPLAKLLAITDSLAPQEDEL